MMNACPGMAIPKIQSRMTFQVIVLYAFNETFSIIFLPARVPKPLAGSIICAPRVYHLAVGPGLPPGASGGSAPRPDASGQHLQLTEFFGLSFSSATSEKLRAMALKQLHSIAAALKAKAGTWPALQKQNVQRAIRLS
jgi:hypothetical protein